MAYYRGFKAEAERLAITTRAELGLDPYARLDPCLLAEYLLIEVITLTELGRRVGGLAEVVELLHGEEASALSAMTVFDGPKRMIVHNEVHSAGRQASNVAHELSHGLLLHPPKPVLDLRGCRNWNGDHEDEANFLGGALLIPGKAARAIVRKGISLGDAATKYGCSIEMVRWRINASGAGRLQAG